MSTVRNVLVVLLALIVAWWALHLFVAVTGFLFHLVWYVIIAAAIVVAVRYLFSAMGNRRSRA
ncbi:MAG: hypothetical protein ACRDFS_12350 [Chloroflexota bacterium]